MGRTSGNRRTPFVLVYALFVPFCTVVHIAGEINHSGQRCQRCDEIIVPMLPGERMMRLDSDRRDYTPAFPEGSFVGIITSGSGARCGRVLMDRDAKEADERRCMRR